MMKLESLPTQFSRKKVIIHPNHPGNWKVDSLYIDSDPKTVEWECSGCAIFVMFPQAHTPLANGETEVSGQDAVVAQLDANAVGYYAYCILIQDGNGDFHIAEGNSPPDMIIE